MLEDKINEIVKSLKLTAADNATFVVDTVPGGRVVFVVLDVERNKWTSFVRNPEVGRTVITEGTLGLAS